MSFSTMYPYHYIVVPYPSTFMFEENQTKNIWNILLSVRPSGGMGSILRRSKGTDMNTLQQRGTKI